MNWDLQSVEDTLKMQEVILADKNEVIRAANFSKDLRDQVASRNALLTRITMITEIRDEMLKCNEIVDMNDYIAQKALVYTLIKKLKDIPKS